ncbi:uncharacterized protein LOC126765107 [Bactrocera neohumeralis]|uniref:uncharacterized protein LOC126765107 n=1 Tax=Bactrocera neohumeralis TaxID=98809 RepID=UPI002165BE45|nr:uncharacterized protein LOC126765107 [Bactrocera neohumeralis]
MGLSSRNPTKLLPSAFPTLTTAPAEANERQKGLKTELLTTMLKNTAPVEVIHEDEVGEAPQTAGEDVIDEKDEKVLRLETEMLVQIDIDEVFFLHKFVYFLFFLDKG